MNKFLREYGIGFCFFLHWIMYYAALLNNCHYIEINPKLSYSLQWGSLPFLGIGITCMFIKFMDDCNVKYLFACLFSFSLRWVIIMFKPYGFEGSRNIMMLCGISMLAFFLIEKLFKRIPNEYFKH